MDQIFIANVLNSSALSADVKERMQFNENKFNAFCFSIDNTVKIIWQSLESLEQVYDEQAIVDHIFQLAKNHTRHIMKS